MGKMYALSVQIVVTRRVISSAMWSLSAEELMAPCMHLARSICDIYSVRKASVNQG